MSRCILITGAAGFIGSAVARRYVADGWRVVTIDNLSTGYESNVPDGVTFIRGHVGKRETIEQLNEYPVEAIIHIAGQSSGEVSFEDPEYDLASNTLSTLLLLNHAHRRKIKSFVYASSMSVYGNQTHLPVVEDTTPNPVSLYAVGKLASEQYMRIYSGMGISCAALRLFNVYGPGQNLANLKQGMLSIYLAQALQNHEIVVKGALDRFRDFVYIEDVVEAFYLAQRLTHTSPGMRVVNICSGRMTRVGELIEAINAQLEKKVPVRVAEGTPGDQHGIYGSHWRATVEMGWKPGVLLEDGINAMVTWAIGQSARG